MKRGNAQKDGSHNKGPQTSPTPVPQEGSEFELRELERLIQIASLHLAADNAVAALECLERAEFIAGLSPSQTADVKIRKVDCLIKRGDLTAALHEVTETLSLVSEVDEPVLRGRTLVREASIRVGLGDYDSALEVSLAARELLKSTAEHSLLGRVELILGTIHMRLGDVRTSQEHYESALFSYRRIDHRYGIASALNNLGILLKNGPRWPDARDYLMRAIAVSEEAGHYSLLASLNANTGILQTKLCEWEQAERFLNRAVSIHKEVGNALPLTRARLALGHLFRRQGQPELAAAEYAEARRMCDEHSFGRELVLCYEADADLLMDRGKLSAAEVALSRARELAQGVAPDGDLIPEIERRQAAIAIASGDALQGRRLALCAARAARRVGDDGEAGAALRLLGEALALQGRHRSAERVLRGAVNTLERTPERFEFALAEAALARQLARGVGRAEGSRRKKVKRLAVDMLQRTWSFFVSIELPEHAAEILADLAEVRVLFGDFDGATRDIARGHALAARASRSDLAERLEAIRARLESRSAESAVLTIPEVDIVRDWGRFFTDGGDVESRLSSMLQFAVEKLDSSAALLAAPRMKGRQQVIARLGVTASQATSILKSMTPHLDAKRITLAVHLDRDPRFADDAGASFRDVNAFAALPLSLPEGQGVVYFDRREDRREAYGRPDLRVMSVLSGLLGLGVIQLRHEQELEARRAAHEEATHQGPFADFITVDSRIRRMFSHLERVGDSTASILILGETGTGKGLLAQCVHRAAKRRTGPLITVNCAAIPETLLESELFGHKQGSFTGAHKDKRGLFEEAQGGTLFLDEISRTSLGVQAKLLHVLDTREVRPVGANRSHEVDVRVVCACNTDLREAIRKGTFLEDLYYRLSDFTVELPPLRSRAADLPLLLDTFFARACEEMGRRPRGISQDVRERLMAHEWRGNVRELMQVVRRLVALCEDHEAISLDLLPAEIRESDIQNSASRPSARDAARAGTSGAAGTSVSSGRADAVGAAGATGTLDASDAAAANGEATPGGNHGVLREQMSRLEKRLISDALAASGWNRSKAARRLGISYPNLLAKIKTFGLRPPR